MRHTIGFYKCFCFDIDAREIRLSIVREILETFCDCDQTVYPNCIHSSVNEKWYTEVNLIAMTSINKKALASLSNYIT